RSRRRAQPTPPADSLDHPGGWVARLAAEQRAPGPTPLAAHLSDDLLEVFWDGPPGPARPPWHASPSGWVWEASPARLAPPGVAPLPTLVALGPTSTGMLWLNLGAFRVVGVVGEPATTTAVVDLLLERLAGAAAHRDLATVTLRGSDVDRAGTVDLDDALALLWRRAARRPGRRRHRGTRRQPPDAPVCLVVVVPRAVAPDTVSRLVDASIGDTRVTVLVDGDAENADLRLRGADGRIGVSCLGDVTVAAPPTVPSVAPDPVPTTIPMVEQAPVRPVPTRVQVCVLGSVEVHGAPGPRGGKCLELVTYLACHPGGAPDHQIRAALWPDDAPTAATWSNRVSVARKLLGVDEGGEPYLRRFRRHVGQLAPSVGTDLGGLEAALDTAATASPAVAADALAAALTAVRGRPFDLAGYRWAEREGHVERAARVVVDATHRLVELALAANQPRRAVWAVMQGLLACPDSEELRDDGEHARAVARAATASGRR
ncbi:MAG TPA: hypothetical protein VI462_00355, partial [Acidimicrobiia bacterium]